MTAPRLSQAVLRDPRVRGAIGALSVAMIVLVLAIISAIRVDSVAAAAPNAAIPDSALRFSASTAGVDIAASNARDLFSDDRQPPPKRYKLPGESDNSPAAPPPRPTVLGTALGADGDHFATVQAAGGDPTIVRVGQKIGGYTVVAIDRGRVTFRGADGERFTLDASNALPRPQTVTPTTPGTDDATDDNSGPAGRQAARQAIQELRQQQQQARRGRGGVPE